MKHRDSHAPVVHQAAIARCDYRKALLESLIILFLLLALPAAWRWTPLNQWVNFEKVIIFQDAVRSYHGSFYLVLGIYLLATLALFPITMLNVATVLAFGPMLGNVYSFAGWLLCAAVGYGIGRAVGRDLLDRIAGPRLDRLIHALENHGFIAVLGVRVLPVAPFTLANLFVGASSIRFRDFFLASLVGRVPGIIVLSLAGMHLENALRSPSTVQFVVFGLVLGSIPLITVWIWRRFAAVYAQQSSSAES